MWGGVGSQCATAELFPRRPQQSEESPNGEVNTHTKNKRSRMSRVLHNSQEEEGGGGGGGRAGVRNSGQMKEGKGATKVTLLVTG